MKTKTVNLYAFDELSDKAKARARQWWREGGFDYEWWDSTEDDARQIAALMGLEIDELMFRGFWSQGDGASFTGRYSYAKGSVKAVKDYAPQDTRLHKIAESLQAIQRKNLYGLSANVTRGHNSNFYRHENTMYIQVETRAGDWANDEAQEAVSEALKDFARWYYRQLEKEYDYLNSDEAVDESIRANEYTFTETGKREG
jgi:hypothetical protein